MRRSVARQHAEMAAPRNFPFLIIWFPSRCYDFKLPVPTNWASSGVVGDVRIEAGPVS